MQAHGTQPARAREEPASWWGPCQECCGFVVLPNQAGGTAICDDTRGRGSLRKSKSHTCSINADSFAIFASRPSTIFSLQHICNDFRVQCSTSN